MVLSESLRIMVSPDHISMYYVYLYMYFTCIFELWRCTYMSKDDLKIWKCLENASCYLELTLRDILGSRLYTIFEYTCYNVINMLKKSIKFSTVEKFNKIQ